MPRLALAAVGTIALLLLLRLAVPGAEADDPSIETLETRESGGAQKAGARNPSSPVSVRAPGSRRAKVPAGVQQPFSPEAGAPGAYSPAYMNEAKDALGLVYDPEKSFDEVEQEFGVPASLLKAIAQVESMGEHNEGYPNDEGGRGLMGLKNVGEQPMLERAAQLLGVPTRSVVIDPVQNIRAAAALLRYYRSGFAAGERTWARAVASYSGRDPAGAAKYVEQVSELLTKGAKATGEPGSNLRIPAGDASLLESRQE